jgi:hypothetical protein
VTDKSIEAFAEALVRLVRDRAIRSCFSSLNPTAKDPISKKWNKLISEGDIARLLDVIIPDCIDETIFFLLNAIDDGGLELTYDAPNGQKVDLTQKGLGELAGWYVGSESWRHQYSKEKVNNYPD